MRRAAIRLTHLAEERQQAASVEVHPVAESRVHIHAHRSAARSEHGLRGARAVPHALGTRGRHTPGRREGEEQALTLFTGIEVDREAAAPLFELALLMREQDVAACLDGESHGVHVDKARTEFRAGAGFGVTGVREAAEFEAARQRRTVREREVPAAFEHQPHARRFRGHPGEEFALGGLHLDQERVGLDRKID